MYYVYRITNLINNKIYIGITDNINRRWRDHQTRAFNVNSKEYNKTLYRAFRKYGIDNFCFEVIEKSKNEENIFKLEKAYINKYDSKNNGYNETFGGENPPLSKAKLSEKEILDIRIRVYNKEELDSIYEDYKNKIKNCAFKSIVYGHSWKTIGEQFIDEDILQYYREKGKEKGLYEMNVKNRKPRNPSAKLTQEDIIAIRKFFNSGLNVNKIKTLHYSNYAYNTIANIVKNKSWL